MPWTLWLILRLLVVFELSSATIEGSPVAQCMELVAMELKVWFKPPDVNIVIQEQAELSCNILQLCLCLLSCQLLHRRILNFARSRAAVLLSVSISFMTL